MDLIRTQAWLKTTWKNRRMTVWFMSHHNLQPFQQIILICLCLASILMMASRWVWHLDVVPNAGEEILTTGYGAYDERMRAGILTGKLSNLVTYKSKLKQLPQKKCSILFRLLQATGSHHLCWEWKALWSKPKVFKQWQFEGACSAAG